MARENNKGAGNREQSPPRTPRTGIARLPKGKASMRALNTDAAAHLEPAATFFDDAATPVRDERDDSSRDSHDLSLADATRHSVVDNMLLSLDSIPIGGSLFNGNSDFFSNFDDNDMFTTNTQYAPTRPVRHRGHTYTSSYSSEYDMHHDETSSRYSNPRGRRSNSTTRGTWTLGRISGDAHSKGAVGDGSGSAHVRGAGKKGSKSSGSSSMDFGYSQILGTRRLVNRSASFDQSYGNNSPKSPQRMGTNSILDRGRPQYTYDSYDAAPTPTIPVGPRRQGQATTAPSYPSQASYAAPQAPAPQRKNSLRSSSSKTLWKGKGQTQDAESMRAQANDFFNATVQRDVPPVPAFAEPPAPSPTVAMRKPPAASPVVATAPKEKQGFFRRVFGSSSKNHSNYNHPDLPQLPPQPVDMYTATTPNRPKTTQANTHHSSSQSQQKALPNPPSRDAKTAGKDSQQGQQAPPPVLNKKHSSFFRRRKKSVSESPRPPLPMPSQPKPDLLPNQPSPSLSSLRKVMNPYLNDLTSPTETYFDSREHQPNGDADDGFEQMGGFSPDYTPHKDATIRPVKPGSRGTDVGSAPSSRGSAVDPSRSLNIDNQKLKLKVKRGGKSNLAKPHHDSFLADSSGNEDKYGGGLSPSARSPTFGLPDDPRRPKTSPTSPSFLHHHQPPMPEKENQTPQRKGNTGEKRTDVLTPSSTHALKSSPHREDDSWIVTTPTKSEAAQGSASAKANRVWLEPTPSEENLSAADKDLLSLPLEGVRTSSNASPAADPISPLSANDDFQSATSLPIVQVENGEVKEPEVISATCHPSNGLEPTSEDREVAEKIFNGDEEIVSRSRAAAWLGEPTTRSERTRKAYMELYDWAAINILAALRDLCGRLILKAETQQLDRIIVAFSERWCDCNPNHGFKAVDVVHTICFALLLLNTDLHMADIDSKMSRNGFVKNTLPSIRRVADAAAGDTNEDTVKLQSNQQRGPIPWNEPVSPGAHSPTFAPEISEERSSLETKRSRNRLSIKPPTRQDSEGGGSTLDSTPADSCNVLVRAPYDGSMKGWEFQIEIVLKEFYNSIRQQRLPLHGAREPQLHDQPSTNNLSVGAMLRRTPSVLSKAPSDTISYRGRTREFRSDRWNPKARSRPRMYPASTIGSSRTSLDDQSVFSPNASSTWSKYSYGKTQTSMSMESLGSHFAQADYQQSIGFANALSQAIIREEGVNDAASEEFTRVAPLLEDESLELAGAPWAKEGILKHKHHLEALDKKAKDRNWNECFAVIEKGYMRLFSFNSNSKSARHKNKGRRPSAGGVVGGGNWLDNAEALGSFLLRQTIASALPPPGYSKARPHVWALSLPTGAVHLFQVGTADIVKEFVSTANYWSARLSKEPLVGGVSNIEYGWSENVINSALVRQDSIPSGPVHGHRPSVQSSIRSSLEHSTGTVKARLPGDKAVLSDWSPPVQSMMASNLMEVDQLNALKTYVKNIEDELARHNELRPPMLIAFSPRHPNAAKAMANWERKSSYLLREIVKFTTYIDSLTAAQTLKEKIYADRAVAEGKETDEVAAATSAIDGDAKHAEKNGVTGSAALEAEAAPPTPSAAATPA